MSARVAFLPGASGAADFWGPVSEQMPDGWQIQLLNWPGAGAEMHDPAIGGYRDLLERAALLIDDGSDVVAQSMGGMVAIGLALAYPGKVRRLVLVATSGGLDVGRLGAEDWRAAYNAEFPQAAPWVTGQQVDHAADLHRIDTPTLLIWGDNDAVSPLAVGQALHRELPNSTLHVVAGGTHMLARERPHEVAALITSHLV